MKEQLVEIDFSRRKNEEGILNESWLRMFGASVKMILDRMFSGVNMPVKIRGDEREIKAFSDALNKEYRYMKSFAKYGLDNPQTYRNKSYLDSSIKSFEKETGLVWPFKG